MAVKDIQNSSLAIAAIPPVVVTGNTPVVSSIIQANYLALEFYTSVGTIADSGATFTVLIEEGNQPNLSDAQTVSSTFLSGSLTGAEFAFGDDSLTKQIGYVGKKQYVRYTVTPSGVTTNASFCVIAVKAMSPTVPHS